MFELYVCVYVFVGLPVGEAVSIFTLKISQNEISKQLPTNKQKKKRFDAKGDTTKKQQQQHDQTNMHDQKKKTRQQ